MSVNPEQPLQMNNLLQSLHFSTTRTVPLRVNRTAHTVAGFQIHVTNGQTWDVCCFQNDRWPFPFA